MSLQNNRFIILTNDEFDVEDKKCSGSPKDYDAAKLTEDLALVLGVTG